MSDMSENEILQAASTAKKVLDALYGLLGAIDQKTGFEQKAADAEARYEAANQKEIDKHDELESLQKKLDSAGEEYESAQKYAEEVVSKANEQAGNTRLVAQNEAGLIIQKAQDQAGIVLGDLAKEQARLEGLIAEKQTQCDGLDETLKAKTAELNRVQGDLDAAKDEIRRKFLA